MTRFPSPIRIASPAITALRGALMACLVVGGMLCGAQQRPVPRPGNGGGQARPAARAGNAAAGPRNQEHLSEWMSRHRDMPITEQQRALESEPGFHELPAQTQQRMRDRLAQLNAMRPEQRNRLLARTEAMERLAPAQRQQVRGAMAQLGTLPPDRQKAVARAFRDLRMMPEAQRQQYLNSAAFHSMFNDQERGTIGNLMSVEPYLPGRPGEAGVPAPQQQYPAQQ